MSASLEQAMPAGRSVLSMARRVGPLALLLIATVLLGQAGQAVARPVFIAGSVLVAFDLLRFGPAAHLSASLVLFCVAPFLRRFVDVSAGYDPAGLMISGPLLGLAVVAPRVMARLANGHRLEQALWPFLISMACVLYAVLLTIMQGSIGQAVSGALKWGAPVIYGMWLFDEAPRDKRLIRTVARTSMVLAPLMGLYGFVQYVDPPAWDRLWMQFTTIASIGQPEPFMVRVFSTMNAPAGYATFTVAALLLFGFGRARFSLLIAAAPSVLGLMLSLYRTAWIALAIGLLFGLFHRRTVQRAAMLLVAVPVLAIAVVLFTPAGDVLSQRLETFGAVSNDASGQERLGEYSNLLNADDGTLIGNGFGNVDVLQAGTQALDGQFVTSWSLMGLVVGLISVVTLLWIAVVAIRGAWRNDTLEGVAIAGILGGMVVQMPLATISSSEIGFLFWSLAAVGASLAPAKRPLSNR